jgi:hypothetical protein
MFKDRAPLLVACPYVSILIHFYVSKMSAFLLSVSMNLMSYTYY